MPKKSATIFSKSDYKKQKKRKIDLAFKRRHKRPKRTKFRGKRKKKSTLRKAALTRKKRDSIKVHEVIEDTSYESRSMIVRCVG